MVDEATSIVFEALSNLLGASEDTGLPFLLVSAPPLLCLTTATTGRTVSLLDFNEDGVSEVTPATGLGVVFDPITVLGALLFFFGL